MWVLDAWGDAEKVWFPIVWEEKKDPSNVVDYDIHEEITKDTSAVINANNDTTTGMAWDIPWINTPKLLYDTSIVWWGWWGWINYAFFSYNSPSRISTFERIVNWNEIQQSWWYTLWTYWINVPSAWLYFVNLYAWPRSSSTSSFYVSVLNWSNAKPFFEVSWPIWNHLASSGIQSLWASDYIEIWVSADTSVYIDFYLYIQKIT